jgi:hypothetical protein
MQLAHLLAAAGHLPFTPLKQQGRVSANVAFVEVVFFCHGSILSGLVSRTSLRFPSLQISHPGSIQPWGVGSIWGLASQ